MKESKRNYDYTVINTGHRLELLDRIYVMSCIVQQFVYDHPIVKHHEKLERSLDAALENLYDAYAYVGSVQEDAQK